MRFAVEQGGVARGLAAVALAALPLATAGAQEIPRDQYLNYIPLEYPRLVGRQPATERFHLYGDPADSSYRDVAPRDGIDDARGRQLTALAVRFAPLMVRNTQDIPLDFRRVLIHQGRFALNVDRWDVSGSTPTLVHSDTIDLTRTAADPCPSPPREIARDTAIRLGDAAGPNQDCRLLALLRRFDPDRPADAGYNTGATRPDDRPFSVIFVDNLGYDAKTWRQEYVDPTTKRLAADYRAMLHTFVHPFVREVYADSGSAPGYELVFQYWFYYPTNDAGNKHEGDWEHVNVVVSPRSLVAAPLSAEALRAVLARRPNGLGGDDPLVMRRIDYFFHHWVMPMDFGQPNAYLPRAEWAAEARAVPHDRQGVDVILAEVRARAWSDRAETIINTHPIVYIGGDSKGLELVLYLPGARNRDSHGSYPFPGLYRSVGPGSNEEIRRRFEHRDYLARPERPLPEWVERLDEPDRLTLLPDWERVIDGVHTDPAIRADWSWLVLPIRWGYPATKSPLAGIVRHAETGNLSPVGPSFSGGWNTTGPIAGFALYTPHRLGGAIAATPQDVFQNDLGFLNAPLALLTTLPPLDLGYKLLLAPLRALLGHTRATYYAAAAVPHRIVGLSLGISTQFMDDAVWPQLFLNARQSDALSSDLLQAAANDTLNIGNVSASFARNQTTPIVQWDFFLGRHWVTENSLRHARSAMGIDVALRNRPDEPFRIRGELNLWEYAGSLRYNIFTGRVQPFAKLGYGLSWYRLTNVSHDGVPLHDPNADWIRQPSLSGFHNLLPNTWHSGIGVEVVAIRSRAPFPKGMDLAFKADLTVFRHSLGLSFRDRALFGIERAPVVRRTSLNMLAVVSF